MYYGTVYFRPCKIFVEENIVTRAVSLIYYDLVYDDKNRN